MKVSILLTLFICTWAYAMTSSHRIGLSDLLSEPEEKTIAFQLKPKPISQKVKNSQLALKYLLEQNIAPKSTALGSIYLSKKIGDKIHTLKLWVTNNSLCLGTDEQCLDFPLCSQEALKVMAKFQAVLPSRLLVKRINEQAKKPLATIAPISASHLVLSKEIKIKSQCSPSKAGLRLVARTVELDGKKKDIFAILKDPHLSQLVSDEGPIDLESIIKKP